MQERTRPPAPLVEVKEDEKRTLAVVEEWVELVRWDIPESHLGDLHSITLLSDAVGKTRYRLVVGNIDQDIPRDRQAYTPLSIVWRRNQVPGGTAVYVEVMSTDGTEIAVNGLLTGSVKWMSS